MSTRRRQRIYDWVAIDLNTQQDFCAQAGRHPMANLAQVLPPLRRMMAWIKWHGIPLVSSMDSHRPTEVSDSGYPICCYDGSNGQRKLDFTLVRRHIRVEFDNTLSIPLDPFEKHQQLLFRQRTDDLLSNPKAERFLNQVPTEEFLVFGNSLELAVKALALGLLTQDKRVAVVADACGVWNRDEADLAVRLLEAKGARITSVAEVTAQRPQERMIYHRIPEIAKRSGVNGQSNGHSKRRKPPVSLPQINGVMRQHTNGQTNGNGHSNGNEHMNGNGQLPH